MQMKSTVSVQFTNHYIYFVSNEMVPNHNFRLGIILVKPEVDFPCNFLDSFIFKKKKKTLIWFGNQILV